MPAHARMESLAASLEVYQSQLSSMTDALVALRSLTEALSMSIERDRAELSELLVAGIASSDTSEGESAGDALAIAGFPAAEAVDLEPEIAGTLIQDAVAAQTVPVAEPEAASPIATEPAAELLHEVEPSSDIPAEAVVATEPSEPVVEPTAERVVDIPATPAPVADIGVAAVAALDAPAELPVPALEPQAIAEPSAGPTIEQPVAEQPAVASNVVDLGERRRAEPVGSPARRRAFALVASLAITATASLGVHELMQTEFGQRILELGTCDGDMLSANRDCALLAWLML